MMIIRAELWRQMRLLIDFLKVRSLDGVLELGLKLALPPELDAAGKLAGIRRVAENGT